MAYQGGAKTVSASAGVAICTVPVGAELLIQNNGTAAVTLGGSNTGTALAAGSGCILPANMTSPVLIPSGVVRGQADADDFIYGRTASGSSSVGFLVAG
jgi:hypothetical protein